MQLDDKEGGQLIYTIDEFELRRCSHGKKTEDFDRLNPCNCILVILYNYIEKIHT